ncbi:MAG TPA: ATP-binding cassette domain-containing protein, partial [Deltaproteobacteria bacterium]|nr:ATP-binding cassette domain-containing protein [Deltaproteobacteria bacterium]
MPISADNFVSVEAVSLAFGATMAVREVSLAVRRGSICGLVGSDGAGKSTLLRMIATMLMPTQGRITVDGIDMAADKSRVKGLIGYMPQRFSLYPDLTVGE